MTQPSKRSREDMLGSSTTQPLQSSQSLSLPSQPLSSEKGLSELNNNSLLSEANVAALNTKVEPNPFRIGLWIEAVMEQREESLKEQIVSFLQAEAPGNAVSLESVRKITGLVILASPTTTLQAFRFELRRRDINERLGVWYVIDACLKLKRTTPEIETMIEVLSTNLGDMIRMSVGPELPLSTLSLYASMIATWDGTAVHKEDVTTCMTYIQRLVDAAERGSLQSPLS
eukprot:PhF_6_TR4728/c0_g1_i1/m.6542